MKRISWLSIGIALLAIASASAAVKTPKDHTGQASCRSAEWPYARIQTKEELHKLFNMAKREALVPRPRGGYGYVAVAELFSGLGRREPPVD